jgi:hypothetical protein
MRIRSSLQDLSVAISREIDSKYDNVKTVAENIDAIIAASAGTGLASSYLGTFTENPLLQPNGDALADGNFYFNTSVDDLGTYYYDSALVLWVSVSGAAAGVYDDTDILAAVALNTDKVSDVSHPLVESSVPSDAVFTDTVYILDKAKIEAVLTGEISSHTHAAVPGYDDTTIQSEVDLNTAKVGITTAQANEIVANNAKITNVDYDDTTVLSAIADKQDTLVSNTNIKTVNSVSILGSGNIVVSGAVAWGGITGTLSDQTNLQSALDGKATSAQGSTADSALQSITTESISNLSDVFSSMSPSDGQILTFDTTNGWQAQNAPSGGVVSWGDLNGTLSDQTDLQTALNNKADSSDQTVQNDAIALNTDKVSYTDSIKVSNIENNADVTDTANVTASGALMDSELASITHVKALNQSVVSGAAPNFTVNNITIDNTNLTVANTPSLQNYAEQVDKALLRARGTGISTSYVATAPVGGTTFSVPALEGEITSDEGYFGIVYAGAADVTVLDLSATSTWVYVDKNNALQQQTTVPTRQDRTRKVFVIRIGVNTVDSQILGFEYDNNPIGHYANSMRDLYEFLLIQGVPFRKNQVITGRSDNLGFDVSSGQLLEFGGTGDINNPNIKSFNAEANSSYNWMSRTEFVSLETNLLKYWDNGGVLTALGSTTCVAHRLYRFSSGNFAIQPGQGNYANIVLCKAGAKLEEYVLNSALKDATFFGWWLIEETATATYGTVKAEFIEYTLGVQGGSSSGLSGALLRGNNFSDLLDATLARSNLGINTTENQTDSLNKRFITDAQESVLDNTSGTNTGDQDISGIGTNTTAISGKQTVLLEGAFVDGDKTKLNSIEDSADVTDAANVAGAGALMDSEVTNLAQVKAFDAANYAAALGAGDNYVTDSEKLIIGNTSGTNSGDQDISGISTNTTSISNMQAEVDLNTAKETNIVHPLVESAVPSGAVFTDTTYAVEDGALTEFNFTAAYKDKLVATAPTIIVTDFPGVPVTGTLYIKVPA